MKKHIAVFLLSIVLVSCNKAKQTTINGQVRTYGTEEAIQHPPVKVQILHSEFGSTGLGGSNVYTPVAETWTDQDGYFTVSANLYKNEDYYLGVDESTVKISQHYFPPGYSSIDRPSRLITDRGGTFSTNYYLSAYGWVNFHFISTNPQPGDEYWYNLGGGAHEVFYDFVDQYRIWDFGGNIYHTISLVKVSQNGERTTWQETFYVRALDTIDLEIKF